MSSSPPTESPLRERFAGVSLRTRLIAAILALMAVICVIIGVTTTLAVRELLLRQLDSQLVAAAERSLRFGGDRPRPGVDRPGILAPGQASGTLVVKIVGGIVTQAAVLDTYGQQRPIDPADVASLAADPIDDRPHDHDVVGLGDYRVIGQSMPNGDTLMTGLPLADIQDTMMRVILIESGVAAVGLVLAGVAGTTIVRLSFRPLRRVAATASWVAQLPLDRGEVDLTVRVPDRYTDPRTEVGQVGKALNRMLGHVAEALAVRQASETRVRQFVADASHELRTPLAAIRGYAELTRRGRDAVPPDVAHALGRIESESARMTALVDDLLLLARLDSGRPLQREPVDLARLVVDTVSDARAAGPDHRWVLDVPGEAVTVPGDPARLHQVLANLLTNARTHTPPGTTVTASLSTTVDGWAEMSVLDNGPGIPESLQPDVFERFARGDTSRSRAAGSTGLGLAIVAAVVEAHSGSVRLISRPGQTSFVVRLPNATRTDLPLVD